MKKYKFLASARTEYFQTVQHLRSLSPRTAGRFQREFRRALNLIRRFPEMGRIVGRHGVRWILFHHLDYAIRYIYEDDVILIVAIPDLRRHPDYWLDRLKGAPS